MLYIELYGVDPLSEPMVRKLIQERFEYSGYNEKLVVTWIMSLAKDIEGDHHPYIRIHGTKESVEKHLEDVKNRLTAIDGLGMELQINSMVEVIEIP